MGRGVGRGAGRDVGRGVDRRDAGGGQVQAGRRTRGRWFRALLAALVMAALVVPLAAATRPRVPAPAPADLGRITAATLGAAYAANRANAAEAARMAEDHGDRHRAAMERAMARDPARQFLAFDGRGPGLATEVFGDLAGADRIAVLIPGSDTTLDTYARFRATAVSLHRHLAARHPRTAVIAWLGYETPGTVGTAVMTTTRAQEAAPELAESVAALYGIAGRDTEISLLCHSYGSVVCARAAPALEAEGLPVADLVLLGSPGTGVDRASDLRTSARVWAGRGARDWIADVPHARADLLGTTVGFGTDPMSPAYGARRFAAGSAGHGGYFAPGSESLANLARIVLGETAEVSHD
ncbi:alpha/beta hydrolase [Streptomyces sp. NPDC093252]|uniref:alpha/beta hydrolase n=1 Tax=Streptomyces sp. NPDC093252 TaxID=3154980 RepID=UPI003423FFA9